MSVILGMKRIALILLALMLADGCCHWAAAQHAGYPTATWQSGRHHRHRHHRPRHAVESIPQIYSPLERVPFFQSYGFGIEADAMAMFSKWQPTLYGRAVIDYQMCFFDAFRLGLGAGIDFYSPSNIPLIGRARIYFTPYHSGFFAEGALLDEAFEVNAGYEYYLLGLVAGYRRDTYLNTGLFTFGMELRLRLGRRNKMNDL